MDEDRQDELSKKIDKADRGFKGFGIIAGGLVVVMLAVVIVQLFILSAQNQELLTQVHQSQLANQATGTANHKKTQAYVLCVAKALTVPLSQRSDDALNACTTNADQQADNATN